MMSDLTERLDQWDQGGGWTCAYCGVFVPNRFVHSCYGSPVPTKRLTKEEARCLIAHLPSHTEKAANPVLWAAIEKLHKIVWPDR